MYIFILMSLGQNLFELGDIVVEKGTSGKRKRIGEIIFIKEGKRTKLKLIELIPSSLGPKYSENHSRLRYFTLPIECCKKFKSSRSKKRKVVQIGDVLLSRRFGILKFGLVVGFHHPDGLYSDSWENGYNGKDVIECVEISGRSGLPRKRDQIGKIKKFELTFSQAQLCEIIPMDINGGIRIKDYWELKR
jgi:hypothetical protein